MVLCVNVRTKIKDLVIEYIEVVLKNGEFVNIEVYASAKSTQRIASISLKIFQLPVLDFTRKRKGHGTSILIL